MSSWREAKRNTALAAAIAIASSGGCQFATPWSGAVQHWTLPPATSPSVRVSMSTDMAHATAVSTLGEGSDHPAAAYFRVFGRLETNDLQVEGYRGWTSPVYHSSGVPLQVLHNGGTMHFRDDDAGGCIIATSWRMSVVTGSTSGSLEVHGPKTQWEWVERTGVQESAVLDHCFGSVAPSLRAGGEARAPVAGLMALREVSRGARVTPSKSGRVAAMHSLAAMGDQSVLSMLSADGPTPDEVTAVCNIPGELSTRTLERWISSNDRRVIAELSRRGRMNEYAMSVATRWVASGNPEDGVTAMRILARASSAAVESEITGALRSPSADVRVCAAAALIANGANVESAIRTLDQDWYRASRSSAVIALLILGDSGETARVALPFLESLAKDSTAGRGGYRGIQLVAAIARIGGR